MPIPSVSLSPGCRPPACSIPIPNAGVGTPRTLTTDTSAEATTVGVYAFDQIKLTDQWSIVGGLRWDRFDAESEEKVAGVSLDRTDTMWSTRAAVLFEPTDQQTYYASYGTSFNPSAEFVSLTRGAGRAGPGEEPDVRGRGEVLAARQPDWV